MVSSDRAASSGSSSRRSRSGGTRTASAPRRSSRVGSVPDARSASGSDARTRSPAPRRGAPRSRRAAGSAPRSSPRPASRCAAGESASRSSISSAPPRARAASPTIRSRASPSQRSTPARCSTVTSAGTVNNGPSARAPRRWISRARVRLPVCASPNSSTGAALSAARATRAPTEASVTGGGAGRPRAWPKRDINRARSASSGRSLVRAVEGDHAAFAGHREHRPHLAGPIAQALPQQGHLDAGPGRGPHRRALAPRLHRRAAGLFDHRPRAGEPAIRGDGLQRAGGPTVGRCRPRRREAPAHHPAEPPQGLLGARGGGRGRAGGRRSWPAAPRAAGPWRRGAPPGRRRRPRARPPPSSQRSCCAVCQGSTSSAFAAPRNTRCTSAPAEAAPGPRTTSS